MANGSRAHRIFFALRPDASTMRALQEAIDRLKSAGTIRTKPLAMSHLHLTLHFLGDFTKFPTGMVKRVSSAADRIKHAPFTFVLDRLVSFPRRRPPYVLLCSTQTLGVVTDFWSELGEAISAESATRREPRFIPHVTLTYGNQRLPDAVPIDPIEWNVTEFVLVDSHVGLARHEIIGRWSVRSPSART